MSVRVALGGLLLCLGLGLFDGGPAVRADAGASLGRSAERLSVLFVGNSYTRFNLMPRLVSRLAGPPEGVSRLRVEAVAHGGYTLRMHWRRHEVQRLLRSARFTHVVLQDHSLRPIDRVQEFEEYAARFSQAASAAGSVPVLYETWPRQADNVFYRERPDLASPEHMNEIVGQAYTRVAEATGARLAPVGRAFVLAARRRPDIPLYKADGTHPTWAGSFLAACVLFAALTGEDPSTTVYAPWELRPDHAQALRHIAADARSIDACAPR